MDAGKLIPVYADEVLPGDTFKMRSHIFARMATLINPVMDNLYLDIHFFYVPTRIIWDNWERFMGARDNPDDSIAFTVPQLVKGSHGTGTIADYLGIPINKSIEFSAFYHRAYNLIWNDWYRDQNLQDSLTVPTGDGPDPLSTYEIQYRNKRYDYFTSCLPYAQKGDDVLIPPTASYKLEPTGALRFSDIADSNPNNDRAAQGFNSPGGNTVINLEMPTLPDQSYLGLSKRASGFGLDLVQDTTEGGTLRDLRRAFAIQQILETDARSGTRYTEFLKAHFKVTSPDGRLQRPEYLGGGSTPLMKHPVEQTAQTNTTSPQGHLAAFGIFDNDRSPSGFVKSFTEHGLILGLVSIRQDQTYQEGLDRQYARKTRFDYYFPALSGIGDQAVLNQEIWYSNNESIDQATFGFIGRFDEYRYGKSKITGKFRSTAEGTLHNWHLARNYSALPALNDTFKREVPPIRRVVATPDEPHFIFDSFFQLHCVRPMEVFATPGMTKL